MVLSDEVRAAFQCQTEPYVGQPHDWDYKKYRYLCRHCLTIISKERLKELTDNA